MEGAYKWFLVNQQLTQKPLYSVDNESMSKKTQEQFKNLVEKRTLELLKRYSHETFEELQHINEKEYATGHFDITTVKLIVETLMQESRELGIPQSMLDQLGLKAVTDYPNGQLEPALELKRKRR